MDISKVAGSPQSIRACCITEGAQLLSVVVYIQYWVLCPGGTVLNILGKLSPGTTIVS